MAFRRRNKPPAAAPGQQPFTPQQAPVHPQFARPGAPMPPPVGAPPQPARPPQPGMQPGYAYPPPAPYPQPYAATPGAPVFYTPAGPGNGLAVGSLTVGLVSIGLLFFSIGLSSVISILGSLTAIFLGWRGKRAVDEGRTYRHRDMALGGLWVGVVGLILAAIATALWVLIIVHVSGAPHVNGGELN